MFPTALAGSEHGWNSACNWQVFEELRHLLLSLAARGIDFKALGLRGSFGIWATLVARLLGNLGARSRSIAFSMTARGFTGPDTHALRFEAAPLRHCLQAVHNAMLLGTLVLYCSLFSLLPLPAG